MLHELCHNAHAPHNSSFYKLWDEIRKECEDLMSKGISGTAEGFDLQGRRLGGTFPQPSLPFLSRTALAAAEKRAKLNQLFPSGPVRLGGDRSMLALNPRQAAAMAAERRLLDNTWCGSESFDENDTTDQEPLAGCGKSKTSLELDERVLHESSLKRARVSENNSLCKASTCSSSVSEPSCDPNGKTHKVSLQTGSSSSCPLDVEELFITSMSSQTGVGNGTQSTGKFSTWECSKCTLLNPALAPVCELCSTHRPKDVDRKYNSWSCKICTLDNDVKLEACGACGNWRYSTVATLTTNLGT
ncbi:protease [Lithospermum erythrorhizon]|uniref:Protease n=1 Tax=Lithospermum erythrorhizon TaxID=34254 RepID=A0AAV3RUL1_LITER